MTIKKIRVAKAPKHLAPDARPLRDIEYTMLEKGYASSRMVAEKIGVTFATVLRMVRHENAFETIRPGQQIWISIVSVVEHYEETDVAKLVDLYDWTFPNGLTGG